MKKLILLLLIFISMTACSNYTKEVPRKIEVTPQEEKTERIIRTEAEKSLIDSAGKTIEARFGVPEGFQRIEVNKASFQHYLRNLPLKQYGEKVHYYDGEEKINEVYEAVVDMEIGNRDLQQCADAVMRLRAEYLYSIGQLDKIHFNLTNGFRADFSKWMNGNRVTFKNNKAYWIKKTTYSNSYKSFRNYMDFIFAYAGTLSLEKELIKTTINNLEIGDVFIKGGSPGHCVIVVDMAESSSTGEKLFMLAQSYMPAQDIQILKNIQDRAFSPWYSTNIADVLETPEWTFSLDTLKRFKE